MKEKILVVDDEEAVVAPLRYHLEKEGYVVVTAHDGEEALAQARAGKPALIVLDLMLPRLDGWEVCRILRRESTVPIIMLTARDEETSKVLGLDVGADDYLTKPFSFRELLARIRALLRRAAYAEASPGETIIRIGAITLDPGAHRVVRQGQPGSADRSRRSRRRAQSSWLAEVLELTRMEYRLLQVLMERAGKVVRRHDLMDLVWGEDWVGDTHTLDVHIRWLREKIEDDPGQPRYVQTVRGVGYRFATAEEVNAKETKA